MYKVHIWQIKMEVGTNIPHIGIKVVSLGQHWLIRYGVQCPGHWTMVAREETCASGTWAKLVQGGLADGLASGLILREV